MPSAPTIDDLRAEFGPRKAAMLCHPAVHHIVRAHHGDYRAASADVFALHPQVQEGR